MRNPDGRFWLGPVGTDGLSDVRASLKANKGQPNPSGNPLSGGNVENTEAWSTSAAGISHVRHHAQGSALP
jgi:hypothetical protein